METNRNPSLRLPNSSNPKWWPRRRQQRLTSRDGNTLLQTLLALPSSHYQHGRVSFRSASKHYSPRKQVRQKQHLTFREIHFDLVITFGNAERGIGNSGRVRRFDVSFFFSAWPSVEASRFLHSVKGKWRNPGGGAYVPTASPNTVPTRLGTRAALSSSYLPPSLLPQHTPTRSQKWPRLSPSIGLSLASQLALHGKHGSSRLWKVNVAWSTTSTLISSPPPHFHSPAEAHSIPLLTAVNMFLLVSSFTWRHARMVCMQSLQALISQQVCVIGRLSVPVRCFWIKFSHC